jgi:hypothetical protein
LRDLHARRLTQRVNTSVGSPCAKDTDVSSTKALHCFFEDALHGSLVWLSLPACEVRSIILKNELHRSRLHWFKNTARSSGQQSFRGPDPDRGWIVVDRLRST